MKLSSAIILSEFKNMSSDEQESLLQVLQKEHNSNLSYNPILVEDYKDALDSFDIYVCKCAEPQCPCVLLNNISTDIYRARLPRVKYIGDPYYTDIYQCGDTMCDNFEIVACNIHVHKYLLHTEEGFWICKECYDKIIIGNEYDNQYWDKDDLIHKKITTKELCDKEDCCCKVCSCKVCYNIDEKENIL